MRLASTFPPRARPLPVTSSCIPQIFGVTGETAEMLQPSDGADLGLSDYIGGEPASFRFRLNLSTARSLALGKWAARSACDLHEQRTGVRPIRCNNAPYRCDETTIGMRLMSAAVVFPLTTICACIVKAPEGSLPLRST